MTQEPLVPLVRRATKVLRVLKALKVLKVHRVHRVLRVLRALRALKALRVLRVLAVSLVRPEGPGTLELPARLEQLEALVVPGHLARQEPQESLGRQEQVGAQAALARVVPLALRVPLGPPAVPVAPDRAAPRAPQAPPVRPERLAALVELGTVVQPARPARQVPPERQERRSFTETAQAPSQRTLARTIALDGSFSALVVRCSLAPAAAPSSAQAVPAGSSKRLSKAPPL